MALGDVNANVTVYGSNGIANNWKDAQFHSCYVVTPVDESTPEYVGGGGAIFYGIALGWKDTLFKSCTSQGGKGTIYHSLAGGALFSGTASCSQWNITTFLDCSAGNNSFVRDFGHKMESQVVAGV